MPENWKNGVIVLLYKKKVGKVNVKTKEVFCCLLNIFGKVYGRIPIG